MIIEGSIVMCRYEFEVNGVVHTIEAGSPQAAMVQANQLDLPPRFYAWFPAGDHLDRYIATFGCWD